MHAFRRLVLTDLQNRRNTIWVTLGLQGKSKHPAVPYPHAHQAKINLYPKLGK